MSDSAPRVVRVLPDVRAIDRPFDYTVPDALAGAHLVRPGTLVRIELHGRRVAGWVVEDGVAPVAGRALRPIAKVTGVGPPPPVLALATWAATRWAGPVAPFLGAASPDRAVRALPARPPAVAGAAGAPLRVPPSELRAQALAALRVPGTAVLRVPPAADLLPVVVAAAERGGARGALVIAPSHALAADLARRGRAAGLPVALLPDAWPVAAAGGCVALGARAAAWAPIVDPGAVVVLDEHDEAHQEERSPTWHARDVAIERARRAGVPCLLVSPCPSLEALDAAGEQRLWVPARADERAGWAALEVVDRTGEEPGRQGLVSERVVGHLRSGKRVVCVLNRTGRAKLLACVACGQLARCDRCGAAVGLPGASAGRGADAALLVCPRCDAVRPVVCAVCGAARLKNLRVGVTRAREELEALALQPVAEVTAATDVTAGAVPDVRVLVGTEAVLHRVPHADVVVFLDLDGELLAPRFRAAEQALALLARASRLVGGRSGRVVVQTRLPRHEVVQAALLADPGRLVPAERARRAALRFPPFAALAEVSGAGADAYADELRAQAAGSGVEVLGGAGGPYLVRAADHDALSAVLRAAKRPAARLRVEVDPLRV